MDNATLLNTVNDFNALPLELCSIIYGYAYNPMESVFKEIKAQKNQYISMNNTVNREHDLVIYDKESFVNINKKTLSVIYIVNHTDDEPFVGLPLPSIDRRRILN